MRCFIGYGIAIATVSWLHLAEINAEREEHRRGRRVGCVTFFFFFFGVVRVLLVRDVSLVGGVFLLVWLEAFFIFFWGGCICVLALFVCVCVWWFQGRGKLGRRFNLGARNFFLCCSMYSAV